MVIEISVFIDSSILVAYANKDDQNHAESEKIIGEIFSGKYGKPVISDYIFDEVVTVCLARTKSIEITKRVGNYLLNSQVILLKIDDDAFDEAWNIFSKSGKLSFTDCATIALMKIVGISYLATFDKELSKPADAEKRTFLKIIVLILGLGPGIRNFLRMIMGV